MDEEHECKREEPPGHFVSDDLREQTAQFLASLRKRLNREKEAPGPKLGPPQK
ncbi:MAG TPA: hypothetical protein VH420_04325 [Gaiellaceae bacterium]